ncbi:MAG: helix-turn-helix transcriptional regulator [Muribaculaceae bacterium]|nr:helix-turn-helix transcriptional regulator [Muribaculaceae bacterium]
MDIADRITFFLNSQHISNSQFADLCGIPRPTVSQILNRRNKKISDEIISKIHAAYPALSVLWLMFGEGEMMPAEAIDSERQLTAPAAELPFDSVDESARQAAPRIQFPQPSGFAAANITATTAQGKGQIAFEPTNHMNAGINKSTPVNARVIRIIVYYSDNSFQEFSPKT